MITNTSPSTITVSSDTRVVWLEDAFSSRRWFGGRLGPRRTWGTWFATHRAWPGMWGDGDTPEAALDELIETARDCLIAFPDHEWPIEGDPRWDDPLT